MNELDRGPFAELLLAIGETYGEPVSDARMEIYFQALSDLSLPEIRKAATLHVKHSRFFPKPAELREGVSGSDDDKAELAWAWLLKEVRRVGWIGQAKWPDDATKRAAMELYGSWSSLCENLPCEGPGLYTASQQFKATFRSYAASDARKALPAASSLRLVGE